MNNELKPLPCPWCGSNNIKANVHLPLLRDDTPDAYCQCEGCTAIGPSGVDATSAIAAWNRRATPSPSTAPTEQNQAADLNVMPPFAALTDKEIEALVPWQGSYPDQFYSRVEHGRAIEAEVVRRCRAQGGNTNSNSAEFSGIKPGSTAPIAEDERDLRMLGHELSGVIIDVEQGRGFDEVCLNTIKRVRAALASQPAAREAARQSIDTLEFAALIGKLIEAAEELDDNSAYSEARNALIAHIDTWGGAAPATGNTEKPKKDP